MRAGLRALASGLAGGAAGTTALNTATYVDMMLRARPASKTPEQTVDKLADRADITIPGEKDDRQNRLSAAGALTGIVAGVGSGALVGALRGVGLRLGVVPTALLAMAAALTASSGPMAALGVADPRKWSVNDWATDVAPHLAYGVTAAAVTNALDRE